MTGEVHRSGGCHAAVVSGRPPKRMRFWLRTRARSLLGAVYNSHATRLMNTLPDDASRRPERLDVLQETASQPVHVEQDIHVRRA